MIPQNIRGEHVLKAIEELRSTGTAIPRERSSEKYDLEYNNERYPPKYIISLANKFVNGEELNNSDFGGGDETNNFLLSLGFNIIGKQGDIDDDLQKQVHDFAPRLKKYLENTYSIKADKGIGRARISFPSGTTIHVRGSTILKDGRGFYHLQQEDYKDIVDNTNIFFAAVFGEPEKTFVFPKEALENFFKNRTLTFQEGKKPKWYFDIREDNGKYYLIHPDGEKGTDIDTYLNKWDQIEDFKSLRERTNAVENPNYWLFIVTDRPKENLRVEQIIETRMYDKFWGLNSGTPLRTALRKDDKVIFSHGAKKFLGSAILDSDSFELTEEEKNSFSHGKDFFKTEFGVKLKDIDVWIEPKAVPRYLDVLSFVKKKEQYGVYFQGGIKRISKEEYNKITNILQPTDLLSFIDLQIFLLEEMDPHANYQPVMIKTLLLSGGKATKDDIAARIKELNPDNQERDFKNVSVYDVLEKNHGIVRKEGNEFILNSVELTKDQLQQLIALCNWKINDMPLQLEELIEAFDKNRSLFDANRITLEDREILRSSFISDFPADKILDMKLDDYIAGKRDPDSNDVNKTTFCYRLEQDLGTLSSIGGRTAKKFGIYFSQKNKNYEYNKEKYDSPEKAFDAIKSEIATILQAGKQFKEDKDWNHLSEILERDYNIYRMVRSKILSVYYPEDFIQIHSLKYIQAILEAFGKSSKDIGDKLFLGQAQLLEVKNKHHIMKEWHNEDFSHFVWQVVIERNPGESDEEFDIITSIPERNAITLEDVSGQTYFPTELIKEIEILLNDKKQIIFYGPPGTSKTFFAKKFAQYFSSNADNVELIQFHPSYSYEDFIEGLKPNLSDSGQANGFSKQDGIFKRLVNVCTSNSNSKYVLIIDEINRGNIAKIFGELIYLLDYRDEKITLTYSPNEKFSIPSNLFILGTMNSADRSIAFVDYALRRRFYFMNFYPDLNINILREWFEDHPSEIDSEIIIQLLKDINQLIVEKLGREYQIGHSYFMKKHLDKAALRRIIDYAIIPLLEQYFFGKKERLEELKQICNRVLTLI